MVSLIGLSLSSNPFHLLNSINCSRTSNFIGIQSNHIHTLFLKWVAKSFHYIDQWADIFGKWSLDIWCLVMVAWVILLSGEMVSMLELFYTSGNLRSSNHLTSEGNWVICEANNTPIAFDTSIILLICLVDRDRWKHLCCLATFGGLSVSQFCQCFPQGMHIDVQQQLWFKHNWPVLGPVNQSLLYA